MFGRDKTDRKEHLSDPYPGLFQNPPLLDPQFDVDKRLPLVRYRILVDGEEDAAGEFHCDHRFALSTATGMIHARAVRPAREAPGRGRSLRCGRKPARPRQAGPHQGGRPEDGPVAEHRRPRERSGYRTAAKVRAMGPPASSR